MSTKVWVRAALKYILVETPTMRRRAGGEVAMFGLEVSAEVVRRAVKVVKGLFEEFNITSLLDEGGGDLSVCYRLWL